MELLSLTFQTRHFQKKPASAKDTCENSIQISSLHKLPAGHRSISVFTQFPMILFILQMKHFFHPGYYESSCIACDLFHVYSECYDILFLKLTKIKIVLNQVTIPGMDPPIFK
jgi:hypothetical protein